MKRSEKFVQANREAKATWIALALVILFWYAAGFGLENSTVEFSIHHLGYRRLHRYLAFSVLFAGCWFGLSLRILTWKTGRKNNMGNWVNLLPVFCFLMFMLGVSFYIQYASRKERSTNFARDYFIGGYSWAVLCLP